MLKNSRYLIFLIALHAVGCQTHPYLIQESLLSAKEHRRLIGAIIGDARLISQNGREMYSHFHDRQFKFIDDPEKVLERYYTKTIILGARRPYEVQVEVREEQKDPELKKYIDQGLDESLSQKRLEEVRKVLNQSRETSQEFDVETPF